MTTVLAGRTFILSGTLAAGSTLTANAGTYGTPAGALIKVTTQATNNGTIDLLGGPGVYGHTSVGPTGGTLANTGTLFNNGLVRVAGGAASTSVFAGGTTGAQLNNSGVLNNAGTIAIRGAGSIGDSVNAEYGTGGTLRDSGTLTNTGAIAVYGGVRGSGTGAAAGGNVIVSGVLNNTGLVDLKGGTAPTFYFYASPFASGAELSIAASGSLTNAGTFVAEGSTYATGGNPLGATVAIAGVFTNTGVFTAGGGVNSRYDPGYGAAVTINAGGKLVNSHLLTIDGGSPYLAYTPGPNAGATLTNAGSLINAVGGTLTIEGQYAAGYLGFEGASGALLLNTGAMTNAGQITIQSGPYEGGYSRTGGLLSNSGTLTNTGTIVIDGFDQGYQRGGSPAGSLLVSGVLTNSGLIFALGGAASAYGSSRASVYGGKISIAAGGSLTSSGQVILGHGAAGVGGYVGAAAGATLTDSGLLGNSGTLSLRGGYGYGSARGQGAVLSVTAGAKLNNTGHLDIGGAYELYFGYAIAGSGATLVNAGTFTNSGTIRVISTEVVAREPQGSAGLLSDVGVLQNAPTGVITVDGGGGNAYNRAPGGTLAVSGSLANSGQITLNGGYAYHNAFAYGYGFGFGALLSVSGTLNNSGTLLAGGASGGYVSLIGTSASIDVTGTLTNSRLIELQGGQTPVPAGKNGPITPGAQLTVGKVLNNSGTIKLDAGRALHDSTGTLSVLAGATLTNTGTISGSGTLINAGTILSGSALTGDLAEASLINNGLIKTTPGFALRVDGKVTASLNKAGTFNISTGSTLTLNAGVGASQTVAFLSTTGMLDLGSVTSFAGVLAGLQPQDTIDFLHTTVTAASASGTSLKLTIAGGGTVTLKLAAPLPATDTLNLHADGAGGTDLVIGTTGMGLQGP